MGKLELGTFEDIDAIILDRYIKRTNELKLEFRIPKHLLEFAQTMFESGFIDCIAWLKEKKIIKLR